MNNDILLIGLRALVALNDVERTDQFGALKADVAALNRKVREALPAKADGTPWTDADVELAAKQLDSTLDAIDAQHPAAGPDGQP